MKEFPDGVDFCGNVLKASLFHFCILKAFRTTEEVPPEEGRCAAPPSGLLWFDFRFFCRLCVVDFRGENLSSSRTFLVPFLWTNVFRSSVSPFWSG